MIYRDTITLYMKYGTAWKRAIITGVIWTQKTVRTNDSNGNLKLVRQTSITVPVEAIVTVGGARASYVAPKSYTAASATWTLDKGFIVVYGTNTTEITDSSVLVTLKAASDTYATIQSVGDNTHRAMLNHWQVEAV